MVWRGHASLTPGRAGHMPHLNARGAWELSLAGHIPATTLHWKREPRSLEDSQPRLPYTGMEWGERWEAFAILIKL